MATVNVKKRRVSWRKVLAALLGTPLGIFIAFNFQPKYHGNDDAMTVLVTVFSVLAGFLVAVMAIVANDNALKGRTWRQDVFYLQEIKKELFRHKILFYLYLWVLAFAFLAALNLPWPKCVQVWLEVLMLFVAFFAMLFSFFLPGQLTRRYITHLEEVIKEKRKSES